MTSNVTSSKPWRMTQEEFYKRFDDMLLETYLNMSENYSVFKENKKTEVLSALDKVKSIFKENKTIYSAIEVESSTNRKKHNINSITFSEINDLLSEEEIKNVIKRNRKIFHNLFTFSDNKLFSEFSCTFQNPEDIVFYLLIDRIFNSNLVCLSYICRYSRLSEDLIEDIMFINSELFDFKYWDDKHVQIVIGILDKGYKYNCFEELKDLLEDNSVSKHLIKNIEKIFKSEYDSIELAIRSCNSSIIKLTNTLASVEKSINIREQELSVVSKFNSELSKKEDYYYYINKTKDLYNSLEKEVPEFNKSFFEENTKKIKSLISSKNKNPYTVSRKSVYSCFEDIEDKLLDKLKEIRRRQGQVKNSIDFSKRRINNLEEKLIACKNGPVFEYCLTERIDWSYIAKYQSFSKEFKEKHSKLFGSCQNVIFEE